MYCSGKEIRDKKVLPWATRYLFLKRITTTPNAIHPPYNFFKDKTENKQTMLFIKTKLKNMITIKYEK